MKAVSTVLVAGLLGFVTAAGTFGTLSDQAYGEDMHVAPGLVLPQMDPERGKVLFASKGCVVCHQVNGIGGTDAASLDAGTMEPVMNPFDFVAKMWLGAGPMVAMQREELGGQIEFTGRELADIIAFVHNRAIQRTFSKEDIPEKVQELLEEHDETGDEMEMPMGGGGMMKDGGMMEDAQ